jgi:hypothetical protein
LKKKEEVEGSSMIMIAQEIALPTNSSPIGLTKTKAPRLILANTEETP